MTNNQIFSGLLNREILQVSFRPTLQWFTLRSSIASELESKYEEWRADKYGNIALFSPKDKRALEVFTNQITFVTEKDLDSEDGFKHIELIFPKIVKACDIKEIRRIGCRRTCIFKSKFKFSELTDLIHKHLFNPNKEVLSLQNGNVGDLAYVMDTKDKNYKTHVQTAAIDKEQGMNVFATKFELDKNLDSDDNLFFDIDVSSINTLNENNVIGELKKIIDINHETIKKYINFLSS